MTTKYAGNPYSTRRIPKVGLHPLEAMTVWTNFMAIRQWGCFTQNYKHSPHGFCKATKSVDHISHQDSFC